MQKQKNINRLWKCVKEGVPKAIKTTIWLLKLMLPVALLVGFLQYWGVINWFAYYASPVFHWIGLPGIASIVFITSLFLPIYSVLAVIATLPLGMREITILAIMCLITHSLIVELAVLRKTGSPIWKIFCLRVSTSFLAAMLLNIFLPVHIGGAHAAQHEISLHSVQDVLALWIKTSIVLIIKVVLIVNSLIILQNILREYKLLDYVSKLFAPLMQIFGLSSNVSFLWFIAQSLGLGYGSAVMFEEVESGAVTDREIEMLNYHIAVNHSLLEDTLLFVSIGVPVLWITLPRIFLAICLIWLIRLVHRFSGKVRNAVELVPVNSNSKFKQQA
ncbi:nucleoside recognition domain-containing protein [Microbacter margulisiae]|uniref:Nucleoside transporter/FeoB GTPase Gate domain-containing protein n=1 Tax=Microbacter margulisiae TaxID=1350067 RepID=A0A7W5DQ17_9PORP|nr:nucleoside recognition domain-containing protein [Microbacter margulisiae]MBB3186474.1 hypothetical protein [Microbacter margulisiae]